jgi:hypothetical protein
MSIEEQTVAALAEAARTGSLEFNFLQAVSWISGLIVNDGHRFNEVQHRMIWEAAKRERSKPKQVVNA